MIKKVKLGKLPKKEDKRTFKLAKYLNTNAFPPLPPSVSYADNITNWGMMGNDTIGDCTTAAAGHALMNWTDLNSKLFIPTENQIVQAYSAITGYVPGDESTDNGAACLDVLNYWKSTGIANHKIGAFAEVNNFNSKEVEYSIYLFGTIYIGIALPVSAQNQQSQWSVGPNLQGNNAPGSWGGHCVIATGFDKTGFDIITWGERIRMTWNFWYCYVQEAYVILSPDFVAGSNQAPNGFNLKQLQQDLSNL